MDLQTFKSSFRSGLIMNRVSADKANCLFNPCATLIAEFITIEGTRVSDAKIEMLAQDLQSYGCFGVNDHGYTLDEYFGLR